MKNIIISVALFFLMMTHTNILAQRISRQDYVEQYKDIAVKEMKRTGIPASITLAQGILESDSGNSTLAKKSNNHFGIKCHNDWTGGKVYHDDDHKGECFRKYKSASESFIDHSEFLTGRQRYAGLFDLKPTDYKAWAHGLKKAGYATEPQYAHRLIKIIEDEELWRYDTGNVKVGSKAGSKTSSKASSKTSKSISRKGSDFVISPFNNHTVKFNNNIRYIDVQEGDTFEAISAEYNLQPWELYTYNELEKDADISDYDQLYIQGKRNKAHRNHTTHTVREDETLWEIAHKYGVKENKLRKRNHLGRTEKVAAGDVIYLRGKRP